MHTGDRELLWEILTVRDHHAPICRDETLHHDQQLRTWYKPTTNIPSPARQSLILRAIGCEQEMNNPSYLHNKTTQQSASSINLAKMTKTARWHRKVSTTNIRLNPARRESERLRWKCPKIHIKFLCHSNSSTQNGWIRCSVIFCAAIAYFVAGKRSLLPDVFDDDFLVSITGSTAVYVVVFLYRKSP